MRLDPRHHYRLWREPWRKVFWRSFYAWRRDKGEARRFTLDFLNPGEVVFDFGGFEGAWADYVVTNHGSTVHVFEPHPAFAAAIDRKFAGDPRVISHAFALGTEDGTLHLSDAGDASSAVVGGAVTGRVIRAKDFLAGMEPPVALAKINIEGGEYDLLPALDQADWLRHIRVLQIQFHMYSEADIARRDALRAVLSKTHDCDWAYPFVWEQWSLR